MAKKKTEGKADAPVQKTAKAPAGRVSWFDDASQTPRIDQYARQLDGFVRAVADGRVEEKEIKDQENRLVKLMKEVEPKLDDALHAKVTELLCELTAYDIMQMLSAMQAARPKKAFRG